MTIVIRPATAQDFPAIYALFQQNLAEGQTHSYTAQEMDEAKSRAYWMDGEKTHGYVAEEGGRFAGMYAIRPNRSGRADHIANASFIVRPDFRGRGVGRSMGEHALKEAKKLGYQAMLFRFVISTNGVAVKLYQSLGFVIVGTVPKSYRHPSQGLVDVYIMHRFL